MFNSIDGRKYASGSITSYYGSASPPMKHPSTAAPPPLWDRNTHLNFVPALVTFLFPPTLFAVICWAFAFTTRYERGGAFGLFVAFVAGLGACVVGGLAIKSRLMAAARCTNQEQTWHLLFAGSMIVAWVFGIGCGETIFRSSMHSYYDYSSLNMYASVNPAKTASRQMMDVGIITFAENVQIEKKLSASYTQGDVYCAAPIVQALPWGSTQSPSASSNASAVRFVSYDFWAVGKSCCGGDAHEFTCGESTNPYARAGLRVLPSDADAFYMSAIRSASEKFGIHTERPLLFNWMQDPAAAVNKFEDDGFQLYTFCVMSFFGLQLFFVIVSVAAVIKDGS